MEFFDVADIEHYDNEIGFSHGISTKCMVQEIKKLCVM